MPFILFFISLPSSTGDQDDWPLVLFPVYLSPQYTKDHLAEKFKTVKLSGYNLDSLKFHQNLLRSDLSTAESQLEGRKKNV